VDGGESRALPVKASGLAVVEVSGVRAHTITVS
jgi:hypothetical protein